MKFWTYASWCPKSYLASCLFSLCVVYYCIQYVGSRFGLRVWICMCVLDNAFDGHTCRVELPIWFEGRNGSWAILWKGSRTQQHSWSTDAGQIWQMSDEGAIEMRNECGIRGDVIGLTFCVMRMRMYVQSSTAGEDPWGICLVSCEVKRSEEIAVEEVEQRPFWNSSWASKFKGWSWKLYCVKLYSNCISISMYFGFLKGLFSSRIWKLIYRI